MKITEKAVLFFSDKDVLSNFYPCKIEYKGNTFGSSEQLFMYLKSLFFEDKETANLILKAKNPSQAKKYGRMVRWFHESDWERNRERIMLEALRSKYESCICFRKAIDENKGKLFIEASPYDRIWGIGLRESDPKATNPKEWLGLNLLGKCLNLLSDEQELRKET